MTHSQFPAILIAALTFGCGSQPAPIVLGHVTTLTGPDRELGEQEANGVRLALDELADATKDDKTARPFVVRHADHRGDPEACEGQAVRLTAVNHAVALIGGPDPEMAPRLAEGGAPVFAAVDRLTPRMRERVIATGLHPGSKAKALSAYLRTLEGWQRFVLVVESDNEEAVAAETLFVQAWKAANGLPATRRFSQPINVDSLDALGKQFVDRQAMVFLGSLAGLKNLAKHPKFVDSPIAYLGQEIDKAMIEERKAPIYFTTSYSVVDGKSPTALEFAKKFEAKFKIAPDARAALAYETTRFAIDAMKEALKHASATPRKFREAIVERKEFSGLFGKYAITDAGLVRPAFVGRLRDGVVGEVRRYEAPVEEKPAP